MTLEEIFDGDQSQMSAGLPIEVKGWCRDDLPGLFTKLGYTHGAEIGVWRGVFAKRFCEAGLRMIAIDAWVPYDAYLDHAYFNPPHHDVIADAYAEACQTLAAYDCRILRQFSADAAKAIEDGSLDFVYIDGNHSFESVVQDLTLWSQKVRRGGVISGHDYRQDPLNAHVQVVEAVHAFTHEHQIAPWYVLGKPDDHDVDRSYLWLN